MNFQLIVFFVLFIVIFSGCAQLPSNSIPNQPSPDQSICGNGVCDVLTKNSQTCSQDCNRNQDFSHSPDFNDNNNLYNFGKLLASGSPTQKFNFMFVGSNFSEDEKQLFLRYVNAFLFGDSNNQSKALFRDYLYKDETDKFNVYYYLKYDANYGGRDEFLSVLGNSRAYAEIYGDLNGIKDSGVEVKEEIDQFIVLIKDSGRSTSFFWPDESVLHNADDVIRKTNVILIYVGNPADPKFNFYHSTEYITPILAHELGHTIGGLADEYYEESKRDYLPVLSKRINSDKIGCPAWCSGTIDQSSQCYSQYQSYLDCVKDLNDVSLQNQQYLNCFSQALDAELNSCNFGVSCKFDTGCYWPMQGTFGFKPYRESIMSDQSQNPTYGQYYEKIIKEKLASGIKPNIQTIRIDVNKTFTQIKEQSDNQVQYIFNIPFRLFANNSQIPFVYTLNGRKYKITFDANIFGNKNRASIYFNDDGNEYLAKLYFLKSFKEDPRGNLSSNDIYPVTLYVQYGDVIAQEHFFINMKDRRVQ